MSIPSDVFGLYIVMSKYQTIMGVYQTFEQALNRACELLGTSKLVESIIDDSRIRYTPDNNSTGQYYDIHHHHFFYDENRPLVEFTMKSFIEKTTFEPEIVNI